LRKTNKREWKVSPGAGVALATLPIHVVQIRILALRKLTETTGRADGSGS